MPDPTDVTVSGPTTRYEGYTRAYEVVTPRDIYRARKQARNGRPGRLYQLLRFFERLDYEIPGALTSLVSAVLQEDIQVHTTEDTDEAQQQAAVVRSVLSRLDATALVEDLLKGHYYGMRAHELVWGGVDVEGTTYQAPTTYERLPMEWIYARKESRNDDHTTLFVGDRPYYQYPDGSVLLYTAEKLPSYKSIDFCEFGAGLAAARFGIFDWFNFEDWAAYNEAFGTPSVVGKLLEGWSGDDKELLETAVMNLTSDSRAVITNKGEMDFLSPDGGGEDTYDALRMAAARARSVIIKSESLTSQMGETGSYAAMRTTNGIRLDVARGLARKVARLLNRGAVYPMLDLNWGRRLVKVGFKIKKVRDLVQQARVDKILSRLMDLSESELRERYNRSAPTGPDDRIRRGGPAGSPFNDLED